MNTNTPPTTKKWTIRKILALLAAGIFITCCGLTSLVMMFDDTAESEPTPLSQQGRIVEIANEDQPATRWPTNTPRPSPTARPTNTTEPTAEPDDAKLPNETTAVVVAIIDGDTIDVEINGAVYRLRYIGMDTPERGDPFYAESTQANRELVEGETVILVKDVSETDRFGRLLRYVYLTDGTFVNAELVSTGYALAATYPPDVAHAEEFAQLQNQAQANAVGLWAAPAASEVAAVPTATISPPTSTPIPQPTNTPAPQPTAPQPTATQDVQPTAPPDPAATQPPPTEPPAAAPGDVQITYIFNDGLVSRVESDEYAVITNNGGSPVNIGGWRLNAGNPGQDFTFPGFDLQPGQSCRVYTNEYHPDTCGFSFGSGQAIWNNDGDCGYLFDNTGAQVSQYCY